MHKFFEKFDFITNDKSIYLEDVIEFSEDFCDWNQIEYAVNHPYLFKFELIDSNSNKIIIPENNYMWTDHPTQSNKFIIDNINLGNGLVITRWDDANHFTNNFCKMLDNTFDVASSAHVYCGLAGSKSLKLHTDEPPNFIIQIEGKTRWRVFKNRLSSLYRSGKFVPNENDLELDFEITMKPGDLLYVPNKVYHKAMPDQKRISISFPCWPTSNKQDRNYYKINL